MEEVIVNALAKLGVRADAWTEPDTNEVLFSIQVRGPDDPLVATADDAAALAPEPYARLWKDALLVVRDSALIITVMEATLRSWDARALARFAVDVAAVARALQPTLADPQLNENEALGATTAEAAAAGAAGAQSAVGGPSGASVAVSRNRK